MILGEEVRRFDLIVDNSGEERIAETKAGWKKSEVRRQKSEVRSQKERGEDAQVRVRIFGCRVSHLTDAAKVRRIG